MPTQLTTPSTSTRALKTVAGLTGLLCIGSLVLAAAVFTHMLAYYQHDQNIVDHGREYSATVTQSIAVNSTCGKYGENQCTAWDILYAYKSTSGKTYEAKLAQQNSAVQPGTSINIYYLLSNPTQQVAAQQVTTLGDFLAGPIASLIMAVLFGLITFKLVQVRKQQT